MYCNIRRLPGSADPPVFRITFHNSDDPGERPQEYRLAGQPHDLEKFLVGKLEQSAAVAARVTREVEFTGLGHFDRINSDPQEIRLLIRSAEAEQRLTDQGKTVMPAQATP